MAEAMGVFRIHPARSVMCVTGRRGMKIMRMRPSLQDTVSLGWAAQNQFGDLLVLCPLARLHNSFQ